MTNPNSIWFYRVGDLRAEIAVVNDAYRYSIIDTAAGMNQLVAQDSAPTLEASKRNALEWMANHD